MIPIHSGESMKFFIIAGRILGHLFMIAGRILGHFFMTIIHWIFNQYNKSQSGTIIILNGPSGSGKSSIQKESRLL
jgi:ABC-type lipoprotein release transport system permease subunit